MPSLEAIGAIGLPVATAAALVLAFGLLALSLLPVVWRERLAPATGVIGAAALVVALHATSIVTGVRWGLVVVLAAGAALAIVERRRHRGPGDLLGRRAWGRLVLAAALGVLPLVVTLLPELRVGGPVVDQPTLNNDAFSYVTVSDWLRGHSALDQPDIEAGPPAYGYVAFHIDIGLRVGEELLQAANATVNRSDPLRTWFPTMAVWLWLLPGSVMAAAELLGHDRRLGAVAGVVVGASAVVVGLAYNQNSASVLGIAMAPLVVALVGIVIEGQPVPRWLPAVMAAAFLGTYTEYAPLLAGTIAIAVATRGSVAAAALGRLARVGVASVAMAPLVYVNAVRSLLQETDAGSSSAFYLGNTRVEFANRFLGTASLRHLPDLNVVGAVVAVACIAGLVAAVTLDRRRWLWASLLGAWIALLLFLEHVLVFPYGHQRAVEITNPLVLLIAVIGWGAAIERAHTAEVASRLVAAGAVAAAVFVAANVQRSTEAAGSDLVLERHVDPPLRDAAAWAAGRGGPDGEDTIVVVDDFFDQLWLAYLLRGDSDTSYATLHPDYFRTDAFVPPGDRRYAVVERGLPVVAGAGVEVGGNERFVFLDLARGDATIVAPGTGFLPAAGTGPPTAYRLRGAGEVVVVRSPGATGELRLRLAPVAGGPPTLRVLDERGRVVAVADGPGPEQEVVVPVPPAQRVVLVLSPAGAPPVGTPIDYTQPPDYELREVIDARAAGE